MDEKDILAQVTSSFQKILKDNLVGIYVHGSIAFNCFHWDRSDIDFIVVTKETPSLQEKIKLLDYLLKIDGSCPPKGLEMSVVLERHCMEFVYPTPFELHFSNAHKAACRADLKKFCETMHGTDKDLAAHFTVIKEVGIKVCGKKIDSVFGMVPKADYMDSIKSDAADAAKQYDRDPAYTVINLCRVLAYNRGGILLSKDQGILWGMENLPGTYLPVTQAAGQYYHTGQRFYAEEELVKGFVKYMMIQIFKK